MTTPADTPTPQELEELRFEDSRIDVQWHKGQGVATRHHLTPSVVDPTRSQLHPSGYAANMGDYEWRTGSRARAAYWYGYAAKSVRLDPAGGHALAS